eukprot:TRINITY_DN20681_c0_g1_i2.p2 TRINITY_DN20681_c0_g1~~TRINITY_DN20681_c0_g1_i2.p2  ORF type:complete len:114 (+),score=23.83 TRINITY_DN20681_c0_g1_i2:116-457(+)
MCIRDRSTQSTGEASRSRWVCDGGGLKQKEARGTGRGGRWCAAARTRERRSGEGRSRTRTLTRTLSLIHISEPTRLLSISYAVFCLKKKKKKNKTDDTRCDIQTTNKKKNNGK